VKNTEEDFMKKEVTVTRSISSALRKERPRCAISYANQKKKSMGVHSHAARGSTSYLTVEFLTGTKVLAAL